MDIVIGFLRKLRASILRQDVEVVHRFAQCTIVVMAMTIFGGNWFTQSSARYDELGRVAHLFSRHPELTQVSNKEVLQTLKVVHHLEVVADGKAYELGHPVADGLLVERQVKQSIINDQSVVTTISYKRYVPGAIRWLSLICFVSISSFVAWLMMTLMLRARRRWQADLTTVKTQMDQSVNQVPNLTPIAVSKDNQLTPIADAFNDLVEAVSLHFRQTAVSVKDKEYAGGSKTEELFYRANFDPLTGLANRYYLIDRLQHSLASASRNNRKLSVLFVDLDQFKQVNDNFGHSIGDKLLVQVGERLQSLVRRTDLVARLGGDEFLVLLEDVRQREDAERVAGVIASRISESYHVDGFDLSIATSIGVSIFPDDGTTASALMANADTGMYVAKKSNQDSVVSFEETMLETSQRRLTLQYHLERAFENKELRLQYQPQYDVQTNRFVAAEALLRWSSPVLGVMFPYDFLSELEDLEQFDQMQEWVIKSACNDWLSWQQEPNAPEKVVINVSVKHFIRGRFEERIVELVQQKGVPFEAIEIEFSEDALVQEPERVSEAISYLSEEGMNTSIDRFGAGYSSLVNLRNLPLTSIKVDQAFVKDINSNEASKAIIEAAASLGSALGIKVGAMGVESATHAKTLSELGCNLMQGYHICEPVEPFDFAEVLANTPDADRIFKGEIEAVLDTEPS